MSPRLQRRVQSGRRLPPVCNIATVVRENATHPARRRHTGSLRLSIG